MSLQNTLKGMLAGSILCYSSVATMAESDLDSHYLSLLETENQSFVHSVSGHDRAAMMWQAYRDLNFHQLINRLHELDDRSLFVLFHATRVVFIHAMDHESASFLQRIYQEIRLRGIETENEVAVVYDALLTARRFDAAESFRSAHPQLSRQTVHVIDLIEPDSQTPSVLIFNSHLDAFVRRPVDLSQTIVAVMDPLSCQFSKDAMLGINAHPVLARHFTEAGLFLLPPSHPLDASQIRAISQLYGREFGIAYQWNEWSEIDGWAVPTFFVFEKGNLVETINGWIDTSARILESYFETWVKTYPPVS